MSSDNRRDSAPPQGPLGSALSSLLGGFTTSSTPAGGVVGERGESFPSALLVGGYVVPGGYAGSGSARSGIAGATIVKSPSPGGSMAFEVMEELRTQVIVRDHVMLPVTFEGGLFTSPSARSGVTFRAGEQGGLRRWTSR